MTGWDDNDVHTRPTTTTSYKGVDTNKAIPPYASLIAAQQCGCAAVGAQRRCAVHMDPPAPPGIPSARG
eukprot:4319766-Pyramimonas_sp.AAC.1